MRNARNEAERRAAEQSAEQPEAWTAAAVTQRLRDLEGELAGLRLQEEKASDGERSRKEIERLSGELEELQREKTGLAEEIGFDPSVTGEGLVRFYHLARELDEARAKRIGLEKKVARERQEIEIRLTRVANYMARHGLRVDEDVRDLVTVGAQFQALEGRVNNLREAKRNITDEDRKLKGVDGELEKVDGLLERLYSNTGLGIEDRKGFLDLCDRYEDYRKEQKAKDEAVIREQERRSGVEDSPELVERVENDDEAGLHGLLEELSAQAERLEEFREKRSDIKNRLDHAGQNRALEQAQLARNRARDALQDAYEQAMLADTGQFLLDQITEEHRAEHEPSVLAAARERFDRYTNHRYLLRVDREGGIQIRDTEQEIEHGTSSLSTGTRMQLLLAVRMAWTSVLEEEGEPLPIFLDEALTTTDPERFDHIARNLKDTAEREGRQVFYLSSQPADVIRWERAIGERPYHIDLPRVRFGETGLKPDDYFLPEREPVPEPGDMSAVEYAARLGVPTVNPHNGAGYIHVFYLLRDDLGLLYRLMEYWSIRSLGQLEQLLQSDAGENAVPDAGLLERLKGRCEVARIWLNLWQRGRGRPVDRNVLDASRAVAGTYIDRVTALADQLGGDAEELVGALRNGKVSGFRQGKADELAEWLEEEDYLDPEEPLSPYEREREVLQRAAGLISPNEVREITLYLEEGLAHPSDNAG
ncbi:hypothetical protein BH23ACT11_BH23ACT11_15650 [soil metagenome]